MITENYVAQQLTINDVHLYYWASESKAEVDFILRVDGIAVPIECKANDNVRSKSLSVCMEKYKLKYAIRISGKNFGFENGIKSVPLYAVFCIR